MSEEIKQLTADAKQLVDDVSFPVMIGSLEHAKALKGLIFAVETLAEKCEKLEIRLNSFESLT